MKKIYLASPYSHPNESVRKLRFELVCSYTAELMKSGYVVFSPIAHSHPISAYLDNPNDGNFYLKQDLEMLPLFDEMWVLTLDGWQDSRGIKKEMEFAEKNNIRVRLIA